MAGEWGFWLGIGRLCPTLACENSSAYSWWLHSGSVRPCNPSPPRRGAVLQAQGNALGNHVAIQTRSAQRANGSPSVPDLGRAADDRSPWPQATQVAYQRNRLARWAEKRSAWAYGAPGRCPGLGEPRAFGPGTHRVSWKKTGIPPTDSDPRLLGLFCAGQSHPTH